MQRTWLPDEQLIEAVRSGRCTRTYRDLSKPDRAWVVAGLCAQGLTAERIAELLGCSLRTVHVVKADPLTDVCHTYMTETETFIAETRLLRSELLRAGQERDAAVAAASRLRATLARVTAPCDAPVCGKGHPLTGYNTWTDRTGRKWCRECHRQRQARHRARKRQPA